MAPKLGALEAERVQGRPSSVRAGQAMTDGWLLEVTEYRISGEAARSLWYAREPSPDDAIVLLRRFWLITVDANIVPVRKVPAKVLDELGVRQSGVMKTGQL